MTNEQALPRIEGQLYYHSAPAEKPGKRVKAQRDPYDGLRPWSAYTHGLGAVLAALGTLLLLARTAALHAGAMHVLSFTVYGLSMVCLYTASTLYHSVNTTVQGRIALRKYDHASIYFLIAGTYTPMCVIALSSQGIWGWVLLAVVWALALIGLVLTVAWISAPRSLTAVIYIAMGWLGIFAVKPLIAALPTAGFLWLLVGGLFYTVGGVLYALKWPGRNNPRFGCHEIFHVFILLGSLCHFILMYQYVTVL